MGFLASKILNSLFLFGITTVMSMTITYIAQIRSQINKLVIENSNLFNKMHEGLVVVSEKDKSIKYASKPAIRLLK